MITDKQGLEWLSKKLDNPGKGFRNTGLYRMLKNKLGLMGYWKNKERGNARKGYLAMLNRTNTGGSGVEYYEN